MRHMIDAKLSMKPESWMIIPHILELLLPLFISVIPSATIPFLVLGLQNEEENRACCAAHQEHPQRDAVTDRISGCLRCDEDVACNKPAGVAQT